MPDHLNGATRLIPIIGDPITYVESPVHLTRSLGVRGHNAICIPMQVPAPALDDVMRGLSSAPNVDGVLVTMPHKRAAFDHCATSSQRATLLGVVSVLRRNADRTWHGDMLDGLAFVKAQKDHGAQPTGSRVLLLGAAVPAARSRSHCWTKTCRSWSFTMSTRLGPPTWSRCCRVAGTPV